MGKDRKGWEDMEASCLKEQQGLRERAESDAQSSVQEHISPLDISDSCNSIKTPRTHAHPHPPWSFQHFQALFQTLRAIWLASVKTHATGSLVTVSVTPSGAQQEQGCVRLIIDVCAQHKDGWERCHRDSGFNMAPSKH